MANINEAFPSNYIKAADLKGRAVAVTIERIEFEPVGQTREMKPVIYFEGKEKGLVLNKTNANKIASMLESSETDEWIGNTIAIYPTETSYQGEQVECVRVKAAPRSGTAIAAAPRRVEPVTETVDASDIPF